MEASQSSGKQSKEICPVWDGVARDGRTSFSAAASRLAIGRPHRNQKQWLVRGERKDEGVSALSGWLLRAAVACSRRRRRRRGRGLAAARGKRPRKNPSSRQRSAYLNQAGPSNLKAQYGPSRYVGLIHRGPSKLLNMGCRIYSRTLERPMIFGLDQYTFQVTYTGPVKLGYLS